MVQVARVCVNNPAVVRDVMHSGSALLGMLLKASEVVEFSSGTEW